MAFNVSEVHELEHDRCHAVLRHGEQLVTAVLRCSLAEAEQLPASFQAELDHQSVVRFEADLPPDDSQSGLFATDDATVVLADGRFHSHFENGPDNVLIDVYSQCGPEFFLVTSEELNGRVPAVGTRLRLWMSGLVVYPTRT